MSCAHGEAQIFLKEKVDRHFFFINTPRRDSIPGLRKHEANTPGNQPTNQQ